MFQDKVPEKRGAKEPRQEIITGRSLERASEDFRYVPVIIKRTDETRRHPDDILEVAIGAGLEQIRRAPLSLGLSAVAAGLILGFTAMSVAVVTAAMGEVAATELTRLAVAIVYPLGFVVCMMSGAELFTEHTATAVYPVLDRRASILGLFQLWIVVLLGNLLGTVFSSYLLSSADAVIGASAGYIEIGKHLVTFDSGPLFVSALLAGWLMALGAWLILATPPTVSQVVSIYIVTFIIGLGELHHSIAGSAEMLTAYFISDQFTFEQVARFISVAVVGNLVGGSFFVAVLNYGHIRKSQELPEGSDAAGKGGE